MNPFCFHDREYVLFVGEGNFTFCFSVIKHMDNLLSTKFTNYFASCFEKEKDSFISSEIKRYLQNSGVNLIFAVDATKLSKHLLLGKLRFNKIVFNFPHVGGKMKIHLNRQLLQDFFLDSSVVLADDGDIIVTLCAGQGGTPAEIVKRRWDDTWQIVEMAARNGFILKETNNFPNDSFSNYTSVGYRGKVKSFNTRGAIVHTFQRGEQLIIRESDVNKNMGWDLYKGVLMTYAHKMKNEKNPFLDPRSPQSYIANILEDLCKTMDLNYSIISELPLFTKFALCSDQADCIVEGEKCYLRKDLLQVAPVGQKDNHYIFKGLGFNKLYNDYSVAPAECHVAIFGPRRNEICTSFIREIKCVFRLYLQKNEENLATLLTKNWLQEDEHRGININIDTILINIFKTDWRQLYCSGITIKLQGSLPLIIPPSLYFQTFRFDISFWAKNGALDTNKLLTLVREIDCDLIESSCLERVFTMNHNDTGPKIIYCFRFIYNSYDFALCKKEALAYHNNLGKAIEQLMHVQIV